MYRVARHYSKSKQTIPILYIKVGAVNVLNILNTFLVRFSNEIFISTVILLPSADAFKKGCCQLQAKVCARITGKLLVQACTGKSVVR